MRYKLARFVAIAGMAFSLAVLAAWPAAAFGYGGGDGYGHGYDHFGGHRRHHHHGGYPGHYYRPRHYGYPAYGYGGYLGFHGHGSGYALAVAIPLAVLLASSYAYSPPVAAAPRYQPRYRTRYPPVEPLRASPPSRPRCRQTREYQTRVIIGGEEVEAYGTACLRADGSWERLGLNLTR